MMVCFRKMVLKGLFFCCILWVPYSSATAQQCGELTEESCGYVAAAVSNWNTLFSSNARIQRWDYAGAETADAASLISILDQGSDWRVAGVDSEGNIAIVPMNEELREQWHSAEFQHLEQLLGDDSATVHLVSLDWKLSDEKVFVSTIIVNDRYPFLHGRILSGIVLESDSNSCLYKRLLWLWGDTRGEISIDLRPYGENFHCARVAKAWMSFGNARAKMNEVEYDDNSCVSAYAWAYATPLAIISFDANSFSLTVSGLGSKGMGSGDCVASRQ